MADVDVTVTTLLLIVEVATSSGSEAVKDRVTVSPTLARVEEALLEEIVTGESVGAVLSKVTLLPEVIATTAVPELPARSVKLITNGTTPSVSLPSITKEAVQVVLLPEIVAKRPLIVAFTLAITSLEVKDKVTVSPTLARVVEALLDDIVTEERVVGVLSNTTFGPDDNVVTCGL